MSQSQKLLRSFAQVEQIMSCSPVQPYQLGYMAIGAGTNGIAEGQEFIVAKIKKDAPGEVAVTLAQMKAEVPILVIQQSTRQHNNNLYNGHLIDCCNKSLPKDYYKGQGLPEIHQPLDEYNRRVQRFSTLLASI